MLLIDNNPLVAELWNLLLSATPKDIASLPDVKEGDHLDSFQLSAAEKSLIGLHINPGSSVPKKTVTRFSRWKAGKKYIIENLFKVKHWKFYQGSYLDKNFEHIQATFFIDPPYYNQGKQYKGGKLDYDKLAHWVGSLEGQVIVCEGEGHNNWLPFQELDFVVNNGGTNYSKKSKEYLYHRYKEAAQTRKGESGFSS